MPSEWINLVKKVQKEEGISYKEAMKRASQKYKKKEPYYGAQEPVPEGRRKANIAEALEAGQVRLYGTSSVELPPKKKKKNKK